MARPLKQGLDYFSLDCYMDDKIKMIQAEFGLKGFAIVVKLWQMIYRDNGYYSEWNKEKELLFAHDECSDCGVQLIDNIVAACVERDIFSKELFQKYSILTSKGIQKRYFSAVARRERVNVKKEYLLISVRKNNVNDNNNPVNEYNNSIKTRRSTQRKVKESKGNNNNADAYQNEPIPECEEDDGMDPEEAWKLWKEQKGQ